MKIKLFVCALVLVFGCCSAYSDIVHLKDGRKVSGRVLVHDERIVEVDIGGGTVIHNIEEVGRIELTAEGMPDPPKKKTGLEKFIDDIKNKANKYLRKRRMKQAIKELHELRVKEAENTNKQKAAKSTVSGSEHREAANKASMDAHNAQIKAMKDRGKALNENKM